MGVSAVRSLEPRRARQQHSRVRVRPGRSRSVLTVNATHIFGSALVNEARFGRSRLRGRHFSGHAAQSGGLWHRQRGHAPIGLPQMIVAGDLNFGGPGTLPQGRYDTSYVFADTLSRASGRHSIKFGGEYRHFINENFAEGTGVFNFPSVAAFLAGTANAFNITLGERRSVIDQRAVGLFFRTGSPSTTAHARARDALRVARHAHRAGRPVRRLRRAQRVACARRRRPSTRSTRRTTGTSNRASAWPGMCRPTAAPSCAPPMPGPWTSRARRPCGTRPATRRSASPLTAAGVDSARQRHRDDAARRARAGDDRSGVPERVAAIVERERAAATGAAMLAATVGYLGSRGARPADLAQHQSAGERRAPLRRRLAVEPHSARTPLGNITQVESSGFSSYHGAWMSVTKRLSRGLQFDTSYTWSKSLDTNSLNSSGFAVQDRYDISEPVRLVGLRCPPPVRRQRHLRSAVHRARPDARVADGDRRAIAERQSREHRHQHASLNGVPNTVRPDVDRAHPHHRFGRISGSIRRCSWPSIASAIWAGTSSSDRPSTTPICRSSRTCGRAGARLQFRVDAFDLFNHPNFGPPGNIVGSPMFGKITRTRLPTGEAGSSRQIQLAARLWF